MIDEVTQSLLEITHAQHNVVLEGHTDDVPVGLSVFPSSWELSSARATSIVRRMLEKGIQTETVSPSAFADTRPLVPNLDENGQPLPTNRARNHRAAIRIG
jgi:chemotaxis protein MotB